jgi:hypothetical protein
MASAEPIAIEVGTHEEGKVMRLTWNREAVESTGDGAIASPWRVEGEIDWEEADAVRLLSATFEEGRELALVAVRPRRATGHADDSVAAYLTDEGEPVPVAEAFLSTEYDAEGLPRRAGVELIVDPDAAPLRVAGDREGRVEVRADGVRREAVRMAFRLEGTSGRGLYELLRPA